MELALLCTAAQADSLRAGTFRLQLCPPYVKEYEQGGEKSWENGEIVLRLVWEIWDREKCR